MPLIYQLKKIGKLLGNNICCILIYWIKVSHLLRQKSTIPFGCDLKKLGQTFQKTGSHVVYSKRFSKKESSKIN